MPMLVSDWFGGQHLSRCFFYPQTRLFAVPARVVQFSSRGGFSEHWPPQNEDVISMLAKQHKTVRKNAPTEEIRLWTDRR